MTSFVCSWSGGKDAALAFHRAAQEGRQPAYLLTMMTEDGDRTRSHGLPLEVIEEQSASLGIPLKTRAVSWDNYEDGFIDALNSLAEDGLKEVVFGDVSPVENRTWEEKVCQAAGLRAQLPLWKQDPGEIMDEFFDSGFEATIVAAKADKPGKDFVGRKLDRSAVADLADKGVDLKETGDFHTVVTEGPIFKKPVKVQKGRQIKRSGYWFQDLSLVESSR